MTASLGTLMTTAGLLVVSNCFMTYAWHGHLRTMADRPWWIAALASWLVASMEYAVMVPANRLGYAGGMSGAQLKVIREVITSPSSSPSCCPSSASAGAGISPGPSSASSARSSSSSGRIGGEGRGVGSGERAGKGYGG